MPTNVSHKLVGQLIRAEEKKRAHSLLDGSNDTSVTGLEFRPDPTNQLNYERKINLNRV